MVRKMLLLIMLGFPLAMGSFWALKAQDPKPQRPDNPAQPQTKTPATMANEQVDLSGTYMGTFRCEAAGLVGDTTLTITGNEFTTSDGRSGRIMASKSSGYTAVAMQINGVDATTTPTTISLRAKKSKDKLTLTPVAGATDKCTFTPSKSTAQGKAAATGTQVASPATTTTAMPEQTPTPIPPPSPSPTPMPTPVPNPSPSPTGSPTPMPSPGEPTPSPTATPSPSPSPTVG